MKRVVITADDFGLATEVNDAVEQAHTTGVLSAASLMVGGRAAADAVARARRLPRLRVGLHLTLVESQPTLAAATIPDLVGADGNLRTDLARYGVAILMRPAVRAQMQREIVAQFDAWRATGLTLDHVNAHQHYHLHPVIFADLLRIGRAYGMRALRVPVEPVAALRAVEPVQASLASALVAPFAKINRRLARRAGLTVADSTFGLRWSGKMGESRLAGLLARLSDGQTEIYVHPATAGGFAGAAPAYDYIGELAALMAPAVGDALARSGALPGGFGDFVAAVPAASAATHQTLRALGGEAR